MLVVQNHKCRLAHTQAGQKSAAVIMTLVHSSSYIAEALQKLCRGGAPKGRRNKEKEEKCCLPAIEGDGASGLSLSSHHPIQFPWYRSQQ